MRNENDATRDEAQDAEVPGGEFRVNNPRVITCLVLSSLMFAVSALFVIAVFVVTFDPPVINKQVITILLGTCGAVLSFILFVSNWKKYGQRVQVISDGLRIYQRGQWSQVPWDDIAAVWRSSSTIEGSRALLETDLWIDVKYGKTIYLTSFFLEMERLAEIILTETARRMFPAMWSQLQHGQTVGFGNLEISTAELTASGKSLAWNDVETVRLAHGAIDIRRKSDNSCWDYRYIKKMPNYHLFLALAAKLVTAETERQEKGDM